MSIDLVLPRACALTVSFVVLSLLPTGCDVAPPDDDPSLGQGGAGQVGGPASPSPNASASGSVTGAPPPLAPGSAPPTPSCADGMKNGTESGVDCGGACAPCASSSPNVDAGTTPAACGAASQACCGGNTCGANLSCAGGTCKCGGEGEACCGGASCNAGGHCIAGACRTSCGQLGQACCNGACGVGLTCSGGACKLATRGTCEADCVGQNVQPGQCQCAVKSSACGAGWTPTVTFCECNWLPIPGGASVCTKMACNVGSCPQPYPTEKHPVCECM